MRPVVASPCLNLQCFAYTRKRLPKLGIVSIPSLPPLPDSQTPYSFPQPSSICLSPTESDACLMHSFLDACKESPDAHHSIPLNSLPLADTSVNGCPGTPLTTNLLPNGVIQQPTLTPNLSTPSYWQIPPPPLTTTSLQPVNHPSMCNHVQLLLTSSTCLQIQVPRTEIRNLGINPSLKTSVILIPHPVLADLHPYPLTSPPPNNPTCPVPLTEDPSSATFPSSQTTTSL